MLPEACQTHFLTLVDDFWSPGPGGHLHDLTCFGVIFYLIDSAWFSDWDIPHIAYEQRDGR
jgi:hypothetical protein